MTRRKNPIRCYHFKPEGTGDNGNEVIPHIPQSPRTGTSLVDCLASYTGHSLGWVTLLQKFCRYTVSMSKTVIFQTIRFSINTQFSSIWFIDRTLSSATTPNQSGPGSDGNEGVLRIPQSSSVAGTSPLDLLVSYPGHSLEESYTSAEKQSVFSTAPADWTKTIIDYPYKTEFSR